LQQLAGSNVLLHDLAVNRSLHWDFEARGSLHQRVWIGDAQDFQSGQSRGEIAASLGLSGFRLL
jgi:hypothetical protein